MNVIDTPPPPPPLHTTQRSTMVLLLQPKVLSLSRALSQTHTIHTLYHALPHPLILLKVSGPALDAHLSGIPPAFQHPPSSPRCGTAHAKACRWHLSVPSNERGCFCFRVMDKKDFCDAQTGEVPEVLGSNLGCTKGCIPQPVHVEQLIRAVNGDSQPALAVPNFVGHIKNSQRV